jgi:hypothetical protein
MDGREHEYTHLFAFQKGSSPLVLRWLRPMPGIPIGIEEIYIYMHVYIHLVFCLGEAPIAIGIPRKGDSPGGGQGPHIFHHLA